MIWRSILIGGLLLAARVTPALSEPVRITTDTGSEGQGWLFRDPATKFCGVVTAAHVAAPNGRPVQVLLHRGDGAEGVAVSTVVLSPEPKMVRTGLDIALLEVGGTILERGCTTSTLGSSDLTDELKRIHRGLVEQVSDTDEHTAIEVELIAETPNTLGLRRKTPTDHLNEGYSGSPVTLFPDDISEVASSHLPVAMIIGFDAARQQGGAVRFDAIKALVEAQLRKRASTSTSTSARTTRAGVEIVASDGETLSPACPPQNAGTPAAPCGWRTQGGRGGVSLIAATRTATVSGATLTIKHSTSLPVHVTVAVSFSADSDDWVWVKAVDAVEDETSIEFQPVNATRVRFSVALPAGEAAELRVDDLR